LAIAGATARRVMAMPPRAASLPVPEQTEPLRTEPLKNGGGVAGPTWPT
jgi:hypothetical protein